MFEKYRKRLNYLYLYQRDGTGVVVEIEITVRNESIEKLPDSYQLREIERERKKDLNAIPKSTKTNF